jgi:hypothetical protein
MDLVRSSISQVLAVHLATVCLISHPGTSGNKPPTFLIAAPCVEFGPVATALGPNRRGVQRHGVLLALALWLALWLAGLGVRQVGEPFQFGRLTGG